MYDRRQTVFGKEGQLFGLVKTFHDHQRLGKTLFAQQNGPFQFNERNAIGTLAQGLGHGQQAVPIGIGLEYGPRLRGACLTFSQQIVVAKRSGIDACHNRARHVFLQTDSIRLFCHSKGDFDVMSSRRKTGDSRATPAPGLLCRNIGCLSVSTSSWPRSSFLPWPTMRC
jgi:hypothetical protein